MEQFLNRNREDFDSIRDRSRYACVRFTGQVLPASCQPPLADIGFETLESSGRARLYVQRGIAYQGQDRDFHAWLNSGQRDFADFDALISWLQGPVREEFRRSATPVQPAVRAASPRPPAAAAANSPAPDLASLLRQAGRRGQHTVVSPETLFSRIRQRVRGQDAALQVLSSTITRHLARREPKRPAVVFALGPSGVGKTQTALTLAEALGDLLPGTQSYRHLRLDMTEYQEKHRVSQLLGAPQGYVGHDEGSQLLDALVANPRIVVLFDEIEKAHPAVLRLLMNAMDAGRLSRATKGEGADHTVDCRQAVFFFTSNLAAKPILDDLRARNGFGDPACEDEVCRRRLHAEGLAPEFVGRIGRFMVYQPLPLEVQGEILTLAIREVAAEYGLRLAAVAPQIVADLLSKAPDAAFGMRPQQHMIDERLGDAFTAAAALPSPDCRIEGPPYRCVPA